MKMPVAVILVLLAAVVLFQPWCHAEQDSQHLSPVLNVYNWADYLAPKNIESFEKRFGVKINIETFDDEETMISTLQSNPEKHDLIITSDLVVRGLIKSRLLETLDLKNIPNLKNIDSQFVNLDHDRGNQHSIPYLWGTTGIAYNSKYTEEPVDSWSIFWNPKYKGKMSMLINQYDVITVGLKSLGYSLSTVNPAELEEAGKKLKEQRPLLRGYEDLTTGGRSLDSEELWVVQRYSSAALEAKNENIKYVIPKEGAYLWMDNFCIPNITRLSRHVSPETRNGADCLGKKLFFPVVQSQK